MSQFEPFFSLSVDVHFSCRQLLHIAAGAKYMCVYGAYRYKDCMERQACRRNVGRPIHRVAGARAEFNADEPS